MLVHHDVSFPTCLPPPQLMLCMLAFVVPSLQAALISIFPNLGLEIRYIFFLLVYIIPRFLSPVIYGFRDKQFRKYWTRYLTFRNHSLIRVRPVLLKVNLRWTYYMHCMCDNMMIAWSIWPSVIVGILNNNNDMNNHNIKMLVSLLHFGQFLN